MKQFRPTVTVVYGRGSQSTSGISWTARPDPELPTVTTDAATNISTTTATSGGEVTDDGRAAVTARGVAWNTTGTPVITDSITTDGTEVGTFTSSLTGLTAGTQYFVRAYATNSVGTAYGDEINFTTLVPSAVYCVPCGGAAWTATNRWHGFGNTNISGSVATVQVIAPMAMTITDIRVELTGVMSTGATDTIGWSIDLNGTPDTSLVATVGNGDSGAIVAGTLAIAQGDVIAIVATRTNSPPASVTTRGLTIGYQEA